MKANYKQRLRLRFGKNGPARYIGHLDLARTMERSMNRAGVPVAYTQGFNRRPRLSFAAPLPLGYTSEYELAEIWLKEEMEAQGVLDQMMKKMAPGIQLITVTEVPLGGPSLQSITLSADYEVAPFDKQDPEDLSSRIDRLLAEQRLVRERKSGKGEVKEYDLRPLIIDLAATVELDDQLILKMTLSLMSGKTGRADEVLNALELDPLAAHIHRTMITLSERS
jgi:radical SAM-linked protein